MKRLLLLPLLAALLVPAAWLAAEWRLQSAVQDWVDARAREGWTVRHGPAARSGFPFEAALVLPDVALAAPGWLDWSVPVLELRVSPLHPSTLLLLPRGPQRLRLAGLPALSVDARDASVAVPLRADAGPIAATATGLALRAPDGTQATADTLSLSLAPHPDAGRDAAAASVRLDAAAVSIPGLPATLRTLSLAGAVEGPLRPLATPAATAAAWRDGGGRVVVQSLDARWEGLSADGTATLSLDGALQPAGAASLRLSGYDGALDTLAASGTIGRGTAQVAHAVLGLMARPDAQGTQGVTLPVTWRDGTVSAGQIPLLRTPAVAWDLGSQARPGAPPLDPAQGSP